MPWGVPKFIAAAPFGPMGLNIFPKPKAGEGGKKLGEMGGREEGAKRGDHARFAGQEKRAAGDVGMWKGGGPG